MNAAQEIYWSVLNSAFLDRLAEIDDIDSSWGSLMALVDPDNRHDLGGWGGIFASGRYRNEHGNDITPHRFWKDADHEARRAEIDELADFLKSMATE